LGKKKGEQKVKTPPILHYSLLHTPASVGALLACLPFVRRQAAASRSTHILQDFFGFWVRSVGVRGGGGRDHSSN